MCRRSIIVLGCLWIIVPGIFGQTFEGVLHLRMISTGNEKNMQLTIKEDKSLLQVTVDSVEISILKNEKEHSTTILKTKRDQHYGFRMNQIVDPSFVESSPQETAIVTYTGSEKKIADWDSKEIIIKGPDNAMATGWITNQTSFRLSSLFPEFLGADLNPEQYALRKAADKEGFILRFEETSDPATGVLELRLSPGPVPDTTFVIGAEYKVFDEQSVRNFFQQSQTDETSKRQWNEFSSLFGSN